MGRKSANEGHWHYIQEITVNPLSRTWFWYNIPDQAIGILPTVFLLVRKEFNEFDGTKN